MVLVGGELGEKMDCNGGGGGAYIERWEGVLGISGGVVRVE